MAEPTVLSIAMFAVFVLVLGGVHLIRRRSETKQGVLMVVAAVVLLGNVLVWAWPVAR